MRAPWCFGLWLLETTWEIDQLIATSINHGSQLALSLVTRVSSREVTFRNSVIKHFSHTALPRVVGHGEAIDLVRNSPKAT